MPAKTSTKAKKKTTGKRRTYTPREKGEALAVLDACKGNVAAAAKALKLPHQTLLDWEKARNRKQSQDPALQIEIEREHQAARPRLADRIESGIDELLGLSSDVIAARRKDKKVLASTPLQPLWTSIAIGVDKRNLLLDLPSSITGTTTVVTAESEKAKYEALVTRILTRAEKEGKKDVTRESVIAEIVQQKPEAKEWLM